MAAPRPRWYRWNLPDFYSDPAVAALEREERWRYRDSLDAAWQWPDPAIGTEDAWREAMDYSVEEWPAHRRRLMRCLKQVAGSPGYDPVLFVQKRLREEYEHATAKSRHASESGLESARKRMLNARQRRYSDR